MAENSENKKRFISLCGKIKREGIEDLMAWLEGSDFYRAPASTRFHGAYEGGLLEHSLNVYDQAKRLLPVFPEIEVDEESVIIATLFHDVCKVNFYATEKRNRKNEYGVWESYDSYTVKEKFPFGGHGSKSVFLVNNFMRLTPEEAVAINCHMSSWDSPPNSYTISDAYTRFPFAWLVHVADEAAAYVVEG